MTAKVNIEIVKWAIKNGNHTLSKIAPIINKKEEDFSAWLNGDMKQSVTYLQMEKLAYTILKRPMAIFYMETPPDIDIKTSLRTISEAEYSKIGTHTISIMNKLKSIQIMIKETWGYKSLSEDNILNEFTSESFNDLKSVIKLREYLGVSIEQQISWRTERDNYDFAFKIWRDVIEKKGVLVFKDAFKDSNISGFCLYDEHVPLICINNSMARSRQIFSLFHELAHLIYGLSGVDYIDAKHIDDSEIGNTNNKMIEKKCNRFAVDFLLPSNIIDKMISASDISEKIIEDIAKKFSVSREVIARKCLDLNTITAEDYRIWSTKWLKQMKTKDGGNYYNTQIAYLGKNYLKMILNGYYEKKINLYQTSEFLNIKVTNLGKFIKKVGYL